MMRNPPAVTVLPGGRKVLTSSLSAPVAPKKKRRRRKAKAKVNE
jgi:hypothetical protein